MANQEDNNVATTSPGILPAENGGVPPTLPTPLSQTYTRGARQEREATRAAVEGGDVVGKEQE